MFHTLRRMTDDDSGQAVGLVCNWRARPQWLHLGMAAWSGVPLAPAADALPPGTDHGEVYGMMPSHPKGVAGATVPE